MQSQITTIIHTIYTAICSFRKYCITCNLVVLTNEQISYSEGVIPKDIEMIQFFTGLTLSNTSLMKPICLKIMVFCFNTTENA